MIRLVVKTQAVGLCVVASDVVDYVSRHPVYSELYIYVNSYCVGC